MGGTKVAIDRATPAIRVEVPFREGANVYTGTCGSPEGRRWALPTFRCFRAAACVA